MPEFSLAALRGLLPQMSGANFGTTSPQEDADMPLTGLDKLVRYALPMSGYDAPPEPRNDTVAYRTPYGNITEGDIGRATDVAMATSGGGLTTKGIKAYHGSPHDFDRFDLSKIGTGEGAQAYGHGLYFADSEGVARSYRDTLSKKYDTMETRAILDKFGGDPRKAAEYLRGIAPEGSALAKNYEEVARKVEAGSPLKGRMYEVNINADPAHFLDWDKPLREQSAIEQINSRSLPDWFRKGTVQAVRDGDQASAVYGRIRDDASAKLGVKGQPAATEFLREAGIPGIKYLDQGSRGKAFTVQPTYKGQPYGDPVHFDHTHPAERWAQEQRDKGFGAEVKDTGSRNYVVFNDKLIDIMRKYGLAGLAPLGYGAIAGQDQQQ